MLQLLMVAHLAASGWEYPVGCCGSYDCKDIPAERVELQDDGYKISLYPGDHPWVTRGIWLKISYTDPKISPSPDGKYHICINKAARPWNTQILCFFPPPTLF
jgi:hypothetical protein